MTTSLDTLPPGGKGVWIPIDHGITAYPEPGLNRMDALIPALIAGGADATWRRASLRTGWVGRVSMDSWHISVSTVHGGQEASTGPGRNGRRRSAQGAVAVSAQVNLNPWLGG